MLSPRRHLSVFRVGNSGDGISKATSLREQLDSCDNISSFTAVKRERRSGGVIATAVAAAAAAAAAVALCRLSSRLGDTVSAPNHKSPTNDRIRPPDLGLIAFQVVTGHEGFIELSLSLLSLEDGVQV
ncbi:unnamed protein product [Hydatigera taeniaeformis]|uniref:Uncharacterized protein n=1 Tax=Hydatigena taeniaeformis TaxID=6205 RepID=A0A0R3X5D7_HYDTA|nr:unnamed protein product [Hydatigera taeniaeformis]